MSTTNDLNGDFLKADEKIEEGTDWQDTLKIPIAGEKLEFGFTLLDETVNQRVQSTLPLDEFRDYRKGGMSDEQKRLMELQRKDELSDEEREELIELSEEVNPEEEGRDKLDDEADDELMDAGVHAIEPTEGDVQDAMSLSPDRQEEMFGRIIEGGKEEFRDAMRDYMRERIQEQPFPIKFMIGQRAFMETISVQGNGFQSQ